MLTLPGGSKLFTYDVGYFGVVAQYQKQKKLILNRLEAMYAAKQRAIGLALQCSPGKPDDGLTLSSEDYTWFKDCAALLSDARDIGFEFAAGEFLYMNGDDALRNWPTFDRNGAERIWNMLAHFRDEVMVPCKMPFRIDLGGEWPTPKSGSNPAVMDPHIQLAEYVWINYTGSYWPSGVPCQDATISIPPDPRSVPLLAIVFDNNPPDTLDIHFYDGGDTYPNAETAIMEMGAELDNHGLGGIAWDIGETNFNDAATAESTARGIIRRRQLVRRVYQWQVDRTAKRDVQINVADVSAFNEWAKHGFAGVMPASS